MIYGYMQDRMHEGQFGSRSRTGLMKERADAGQFGQDWADGGQD